ncbi:terminase family protein [Enterobacter asburiae]|uniref:terminase large subunit domain-containing protein n=1 Tax=Enterobacter asburiae TaxID=61645 RepID=UPI00200340FB|nr:terminase family protein [Enterobacter asburiae]MCK7142566.1 terminase family protein [Enterobacter asburiae]
MTDELAALEATITPEMLLAMSEDEQAAFIQKFNDYIKYRKYNRLEYLQPYGYQKQFMSKSAEFNKRFLRAGNRVGKTWCGALEMAYHITGRYPDWWTGKRIEGSGKKFWCIGVTQDMARDIQQRQLLGTEDATLIEELGSGTIPRECIELDRGFKRDGQRVENCKIRHVDGGLNSLSFFGSNDEGSGLMGREISCIWIDEESPYSTSVFSQCQMRVINALGIDQDGLIYITATPEQGNTALNQLFTKNEGGELYLQEVTWWDVPERFTPQRIEKLLASIPSWQRDMRAKGLPVVGKGAVFEFDDSEVEINDFEIKPLPHWGVIGGLDIGHVHDPSVITITYYDPDNDRYILAKEWVLDESEEARSARGIARVLKDSEFANVPLQVPPDAGRNSDAVEAVAKLLIEYGINVIPVTFRNPTDYDLNIQYTTKGGNPRKIEPGLAIIRDLVSKGKYKVSNACGEWFRQKHIYSYKYNERTQSLDYAGDEHSIDSGRYGLMSYLNGNGCYVYELAESNQLRSFNTVNLNF